MEEFPIVVTDVDEPLLVMGLAWLAILGMLAWGGIVELWRLARSRERWRTSAYEHRLERMIQVPQLTRCATIAVMSPKGGVGKTTVSALLGTLFALLRRDRVVAVDTNPDFGSLGRSLTPGHGVYVDDLLTVLASSAEVRHTARAVPGLREATQTLAAEHPKAQQIAAILAVPDDEVVRVIHPAARAGFQVLVRGVANVEQFHALLADAVTGDPAHGLLPGARPDPWVLAAYQDAPALDEGLVAFTRFQFFRRPAKRKSSSRWLPG